MAKRHPATEAGIIVSASGGYEKRFPPPQWRQAIRVALSRYWSSGTGLGVMPTYVDIHFVLEHSNSGLEHRVGRSTFVKFNFLPRDLCADVFASLMSDTHIVAPGARLLQVDDYPNRDGVAAALTRFSWSNWFEGLVVPVKWSRHHSRAIDGDKITLWVTKRGLIIYNGEPLQKG